MPPVKRTLTVKDADGKEHTLTIHRGKGRHQLTAQRAAGGDTALIPASIVQQLVTYDGEKLTLEDWLDTVDLEIFLEAQGAVLGGDPGKETTAATS